MGNLYQRYFVDPFRENVEADAEAYEHLRQVSTFVSHSECQQLEDWVEREIRSLEVSGPVEHGQSLFNAGATRGLRMVQDHIRNLRQQVKEEKP